MTTIVPFADRNKLPACAGACKALYDANANCVPPIIPSGPVSNYEACFCVNQYVAALSTATDAVCNDVCSTEQGGQASVASWFGSLCHVTAPAGGNNNGGGKTTKTSTSSTRGGSSGSTGSGSSNNSGNWYVHTHALSSQCFLSPHTYFN